MSSAPGLEPKLLTAVSVAPAGALTESTTSAASMKRRIRNLRDPALHAMCRGVTPARPRNTVVWRARLLDDSNRHDFRRGREPSVIDDGAMVDTPRTKLQPRPVRRVHKLRVTVNTGLDAGTTCAPDDGARLAIGTSADNALVLTDPAVSRYHLELLRTPAGVEVIDLGSRNGTWVGGVRITRAIVPAGTQLRVGDTTLVVEEAGQAVVPPPSDVPRSTDLVGDSDAIREVARLVH